MLRLGFLLILLCVAAAAAGGASIQFTAGSLRLRLDTAGHIVALSDEVTKTSVLAPGQSPALLSAILHGQTLTPAAAIWDGKRRLTLAFGAAQGTATVTVVQEPTHLTLELVDWQGPLPERVVWGAYPTTVCETVGGVVAVVRDQRVALGLQSLNVQTKASAWRAGATGNLVAESLQHDGGILGSKIALFGCPAKSALETLGKIELAEGLPHPMLDGQWGKMSPTAREPYLIVAFGEKDFDQVLDLAKRTGIRYVYHPGPFLTWGHFELNPTWFPDGEASFRRCVDKADKVGVRVGVHTLSGFITTNDPYVTPVPDHRLARMGSTTLSSAVDAAATQIPLADPAAFRNRQTLGCAIIGQELVQYASVSPAEPWQLLGCTRGAFGTTAAAHGTGADIGKLPDHEYGTLYPSVETGMMDEMATRLGEFCNRMRVRQMSFDGLEGLASFGYGEYAEERFVNRVYGLWKPEIISDASNLLHFNWHAHTRMNWGELTQSAKVDVDVYRAGNCQFFADNLLPAAVGWWRFGTARPDWEATRLEDVEYLLAKAAGYRATHGMETDPSSVAAHGYGPECLKLVRDWDDAKAAEAFTEAQRTKLRERGRDFHLTAAGRKRWELREVKYSPCFWAAPGSGWREGFDLPSQVLSFNTTDEQARGMESQIDNPYEKQPLRFELRVVGSFDDGSAENKTIALDATAFQPHHQLPEGAQPLLVTAEGKGLRLATKYEGKAARSASIRSIASLPQALNLSQHRGLGVWVDGDGQGELLFIELIARGAKRQYYVPITFTGRRYFEFPAGEMSLQRYYSYDWGGANGFAAWWNTLKGFDYGHVEQIAFGFNNVPAGRAVSCAVERLLALKELGTGIRDVTLTVGDRRLEVAGAAPPRTAYLIYAGGAEIEARDLNYRLLAKLPTTGGPVMVGKGAHTAQLKYQGEGNPAPWTRIEYECVGPAETVAAR